MRIIPISKYLVSIIALLLVGSFRSYRRESVKLFPSFTIRALSSTKVDTTTTRPDYPKRKRTELRHHHPSKIHPTNGTTLEEIAQPLLSEAFIASVIRQWTTPMPRGYLTRPLIITGPSGAGKGRIISDLMKDYHKFFHKVVTYTTRPPRATETNGKQYYFLSNEAEFQQFNTSGFFLETARIHNYSYGISYYGWLLATRNSSGLARLRTDRRQQLYLEAGPFEETTVKIPLLEVDLQGVQFFREHQRQLRIKPYYVFIEPPTLQSLEERLLERDSESEEQRVLRLQNAQQDLVYLENHRQEFDRIIRNEDLSLASNQIFRAVRDWYPMLPAASTMGFLRRRIKSIKALAKQNQTIAAVEKEDPHNSNSNISNVSNISNSSDSRGVERPATAIS